MAELVFVTADEELVEDIVVLVRVDNSGHYGLLGIGL
jgi:hypothetical protein